MIAAVVLPVPDSPLIRTLCTERAAQAISSLSSCIWGLLPIILEVPVILGIVGVWEIHCWAAIAASVTRVWRLALVFGVIGLMQVTVRVMLAIFPSMSRRTPEAFSFRVTSQVWSG